MCPPFPLVGTHNKVINHIYLHLGMSLLHLHKYHIYTHRSGIPRHQTKTTKAKKQKQKTELAPWGHIPASACLRMHTQVYNTQAPTHKITLDNLGCKSTTLSLSINKIHLSFPFHLLFPIESSGIISRLPLPVGISRDETISQTTAPSAAYDHNSNNQL